jgi:carboxypeptidase family protein
MLVRLRCNSSFWLLPLITVLPWNARPVRADVYGVILGTVTDPSGAVVPGAKVVLQNNHTGLKREAQTDAAGNYEFLAIPVGEDYAVVVEASGFRKSTQTGIKLLVDQRFRADFRLEVGSTTQEVSVSANAAQVETVSTQLGDVIQDKKMEDLPLNGRSYLDLMGLQAGVAPINTSSTGAGQPVSGNITGGLLSVNGQREDANLFMVNGGNVEEVGNNGTSILPTLDSIQEFRLLTNSFDAEYGNFSGAIMNAVTKSGTNSLHGTAFEFLRNQKLDSRNFFDYNQVNSITGQEIPNSAIGVFRRNQFGGVVGGPILKDRLFFFVDYQGTREARGASTGIVPVPSFLEQSGNFSDVGTTGYAPFTGSVRGDNNPADGAMPTVLSQRLGYTVVSGEPYYAPGCNTLADAQAGMCVFPNMMIPQSVWSSAAKGLLHFIPAPTGTLSTGTPFFSSSSLPATTRDDKFAPRIDLVNKLTGNWNFYYHFDDASVVNPYASSNIPGFTATSPSRAQQINIGNTRTFSSSSVNEFRANFVRVAYPGTTPTGGVGKVSSFGFLESGLGLLPQNPLVEGVPHISLNQLGLSFGAALPSGLTQNAYTFQDSFSRIVGRHTVKFGGLFGYSQWNQVDGGSLDGVYGFNGTETGNDFADFLIGAPDQFHQDSDTWIQSRVKTAAAFAQDSFRVRSNLTVNYGLRWELGEPWYDTKNRLQAFVPGLQSTLYPNSPKGWVFPLDPGISRTLAPTQLHNFPPRLGVAYSPNSTGGLLGKLFGGPGKTSIRAAAGMFYTSFNTNWQGYEEGDPPFSNYFVVPTLIYLEEPYKSRLSGNNPGQRFPVPPLSPNVSFASFLPINGVGYQTTNVTPYAEDFNFTLQRQIARSTVVTLGFVGTRAHHLFSELEYNPGNIAKCLEIANLYAAAGQAGSGCGPFGEDNIYSINGQTFYGTRPYSVTSGRYLSQGLLDFLDSTWETTMGNSNYNALQVSVNKMAGPVRFLAAYTYSKSLDEASQFLDLIDPYNFRLSKALSVFDLTHNFVVSYSYDLPLHRLAHAQSGVLHGILAGWTFSGITRFSTGVPVSLSEGDDQSLCGCELLGTSSVDFPDYNDQPIHYYNPRNSTGFQQFSTTPFSRELLGQQGTANRRFFHGPGLNNWDISFFKNVHINERVSLDIRAEFFNAFNHAQFNNPVGSFSASNFGDVVSANSPRIGQVAAKIHF